ncbi:hypothetical protein BV25DRAFT_1645765 [Artomyces pyxidatus]|uniref:Uncharacterized protein n=1 Tax=Artomyces pyxidatus TaxID=48021 RepID=A0ACB8SJ67_9AGAM|nr:hypothetical protein BV25DRAFT_1645765 [Artomyces pyxidatus]
MPSEHPRDVRIRCMHPGCTALASADLAYYCGPAHCALATSQANPLSLLCQNCRAHRGNLVDKATSNRFCSSACASDYAWLQARFAAHCQQPGILLNETSRPSPAGVAVSTSSIPVGTTSSVRDICIVEGCHRRAHLGPDGASYGFCSDEHRTAAFNTYYTRSSK